jgi:hypothetical protein
MFLILRQLLSISSQAQWFYNGVTSCQFMFCTRIFHTDALNINKNAVIQTRTQLLHIRSWDFVYIPEWHYTDWASTTLFTAMRLGSLSYDSVLLGDTNKCIPVRRRVVTNETSFYFYVIWHAVFLLSWGFDATQRIIYGTQYFVNKYTAFNYSLLSQFHLTEYNNVRQDNYKNSSRKMHKREHDKL